MTRKCCSPPFKYSVSFWELGPFSFESELLSSNVSTETDCSDLDAIYKDAGDKRAQGRAGVRIWDEQGLVVAPEHPTKEII